MDPDFASRRSVVVCKHGCVASSQPLASQIGLEILKTGGNAADAAVSVAAALNVTEPCSTGIGGDAFCLFYDARTKKVNGLNGSGRSSADATLSRLAADGFTRTNMFPRTHGHAVSVPGAASAWEDTITHFGSGKLSLRDILQPAIELAETGFPVQTVTAMSWKNGEYLLASRDNCYGRDMLLNGQAPRHGEIMKMPLLANTFQEVANHGKAGFYQGRIARAISAVVQQHGGLLTPEDLAAHCSTLDEPIFTDYRRHRVWEMPPNGQGLTALIALNILEGFELQDLQHNSSEYLHLLLEAVRASFAETLWHVADPTKTRVPLQNLLSKELAAKKRALINPDRAKPAWSRCAQFTGSDTVYFCVVDKDGNACSFINSNYNGFGTAIVPEGCGFTLQNRGYGFSLDPECPNAIAPSKRPFHTIIPSLITHAETGELLSTFGVMGGFMQPQGHVQVLLNQIEFGMDPQRALDQPRFYVSLPAETGETVDTVLLEEGIKPEVVLRLREMGHNIPGLASGVRERQTFGRGQIITRGAWWDRSNNRTVCKEPNVYWAGSDPRADGIVAGY